jgi:excisionase family DNA binding protein
LLTIKQAAETLQVSRPTLYRLFDSGLLPWVQIGSHRRVAGSEIQRFIAENAGGGR